MRTSLIFVVTMWLSLPVGAQTRTKPEAEADFTSLRSALLNGQARFLAANGRYARCIEPYTLDSCDRILGASLPLAQRIRLTCEVWEGNRNGDGSGMECRIFSDTSEERRVYRVERPDKHGGQPTNGRLPEFGWRQPIPDPS